jgi:hypothetical protein
MAGDDIRPLAGPELASTLTPEIVKWFQKRLFKVWPGGTLTLVSRKSLPSDPSQISSTFRVVKGADASLVEYVVKPDGKASDFSVMLDRPYE